MSAKFGQSITVSLFSGEVVVIEDDEYLIPRFETKEEEKTSSWAQIMGIHTLP